MKGKICGSNWIRKHRQKFCPNLRFWSWMKNFYPEPNDASDLDCANLCMYLHSDMWNNKN